MLAAFRNVHNQMILFLSLLALTGIFSLPDALRVPALLNVIASVSAAALLDSAVNYYRFKKFELPKSGIISGFFVGMILPFNYVFAAFAAFLAVASKHIIRVNKRHIFNPASFGIIVSSLLFPLSASWWVATTLLLVPIGLVIIHGIRRIWAAAFFLGTYLILTAITSLAKFGSFNLLSIFDLTLLFFALFMLIEPRTSPHPRKAMMFFGVLVALFAFVLKDLASADFLLLALLAGNLFTDMLNKKFR
ncbi:hypothetical protein HY642_00125 [Candidatus Woesearchaeota archaeon]|nr:hypothetical protein [Candidatus Woesearchaeota archaeon]